MSDRDHELFEAELRKLTPAPPPPELMARLHGLVGAHREHEPERSGVSAERRHLGGTKSAALCRDAAAKVRWRLFRWLAPAAAAAALIAALLFWQPSAPDRLAQVKPAAASLKIDPKPDDIEIDRQLVAAFDAVAQLPGGQPVRFRCREWADEVVLRDPARGIVIERRTPRLEIVPVCFETY